MVHKSWGQKRICSCGKIRFYDLNKKRIECPECAEMIDIDFLAKSSVEKNFFKKKGDFEQNLKKNFTSGIVKKKPKKSIEEDVEKETSVDIDDASKLSVDEIIGNKEGKPSKGIEDSEDEK